MPPILKLMDQNKLVKTSIFPLANWKYENFNPIQSRFIEYYDKDISGLVAASTSSGKTLIAEMAICDEVRRRGGKALYLCPLKALGQEKIDDWCDPEYHFKDLKISICTGDYRLTKARFKELCEADIIIATNEMIAHHCRNFNENNEWLGKIKTIVCDEFHGIGSKNRGSHAEIGLMKFCQINPDARLILLSATMPNVEELAEWVSYALTKKQAFVLKSDYRPCPLNIHYEIYNDYGSYSNKEDQKIETALELIDEYKDDKFIVFVHTKNTGEKMLSALKEEKIKAEYHNAGLEKNERVSLEKRFREDKNFRVVVATSTLSQGLNMPARRVIVLGVHRGLEEIDASEAIQECGRAGRPSYDPMGDAYILIPKTKEQYFRNKLKSPEPIRSQLLEDYGGVYKNLAFHLVSEIHHGDVKTKTDVHDWYSRSLAAFQNKKLEDFIIDSTLESLVKCGAIFLQENGEYKASAIGKISSMFYFSPFDVSDLKKNFNELFNRNKEDDDYWVSMALGNLDTNRCNIVTSAEKSEMFRYFQIIQGIFFSKYSEPAIKAGYCYYSLMNGFSSGVLTAIRRNLQFDFPRLIQILKVLDSLSCKWDKEYWFDMLESRVRYGVKSELLVLCRVNNIGKVRAEKLWEKNIRTLEDLADSKNSVRLRTILSMKAEKITEIQEEAKNLLIIGGI